MSLRRYAVATEGLFFCASTYVCVQQSIIYVCVAKHFYNLKDSHVGGLDVSRKHILSLCVVKVAWPPNQHVCTYVCAPGRPLKVGSAIPYEPYKLAESFTTTDMYTYEYVLCSRLTHSVPRELMGLEIGIVPCGWRSAVNIHMHIRRSECAAIAAGAAVSDHVGKASKIRVTPRVCWQFARTYATITFYI